MLFVFASILSGLFGWMHPAKAQTTQVLSRISQMDWLNPKTGQVLVWQMKADGSLSTPGISASAGLNSLSLNGVTIPGPNIVLTNVTRTSHQTGVPTGPCSDAAALIIQDDATPLPTMFACIAGNLKQLAGAGGGSASLPNNLAVLATNSQGQATGATAVGIAGLFGSTASGCFLAGNGTCIVPPAGGAATIPSGTAANANTTMAQSVGSLYYATDITTGLPYEVRSTSGGSPTQLLIPGPSGAITISPNGQIDVNPSVVPTAGSGFSGTKTIGSCTMTFSSGVVTNITGC